MKVIILDQLGCYSAVVAASYLAGLINETPTITDIYELACFAAHRDLQVGKIYYIGQDSNGNEYYSLGVGKEEKLVKRSARDLLNIIGDKGTICIIGVSLSNPLSVRFFAYLVLFSPLRIVSKRVTAYILKIRFAELITKVKKEVNI
jgi:hypothetical protein